MDNMIKSSENTIEEFCTKLQHKAADVNEYNNFMGNDV